VGKESRRLPGGAKVKHIQFNNGHYLILFLPFHKSLEIGFQDSFSKRFEFDCSLTFSGRDHAGFQFSIQLWGWFFFEFNLTDTRHWSYQANRWMTPKEEQIDEWKDARDQVKQALDTIWLEIENELDQEDDALIPLIHQGCDHLPHADCVCPREEEFSRNREVRRTIKLQQRQTNEDRS
jgi:hypothetical protein